MPVVPGLRDIGQKRVRIDDAPVGQAVVVGGDERQDLVRGLVAEQQTARSRPGQRHRHADVRGDAEEARAAAAVQHDVFVAPQRAKLRRGIGLGGERLQQWPDMPLQRVRFGIGGAVELHRAAEEHGAVLVHHFQQLGGHEPVDEVVERRAGRAEAAGQIADADRCAAPQQLFEDVDDTVDAALAVAGGGSLFLRHDLAQHVTCARNIAA